MQLKNVEFHENSELMIIEENAFGLSLIEDFSVPSSVTELKDKWCRGMKILDKVTIMPNNPIYKNIDDKMIVGKSDPKSDIYDILVFARRDIEEAKIPSFIKQIAPFAFQGCGKLKKVEFEKNSQLQIIGRHAFNDTKITTISIPSNVKQVSHRSFSRCLFLKSVCFSNNSKLEFIDQFAFAHSQIRNFLIPSNVIALADQVFDYCHSLEIIEYDENSKLNSINFWDFCELDPFIIMIPSKMKIFLENDW